MQVRSATEPLKVILESQFRPSQGNYVIEVQAWPRTWLVCFLHAKLCNHQRNYNMQLC